MPVKSQTLLTLVLVAVVVVSAGVIAPSGEAESGGPRLGRPAPEITGAPWINSEALSLRKLRGRVVYVEFWTYG